MTRLLLLLAVACGAPSDDPTLGRKCSSRAQCGLLSCIRKTCTVRCEPVKLKFAEPVAELSCDALGGVCGEYDICYPRSE
jgi:hypothetical protein